MVAMEEKKQWRMDLREDFCDTLDQKMSKLVSTFTDHVLKTIS